MNWFPKLSAWDYQQRIVKWQKARAQGYLQQNDAVASAFANVRDSFATGRAELAAKAALARVTDKKA